MLIVFGFFVYYIGNNDNKSNELLVNAEVDLNLKALLESSKTKKVSDKVEKKN